MTPIKNTKDHYGQVAIFFHWFMAILLFILLGLGIYMVPLPISLHKLKMFGWHKDLGMLALLMVILRYAWRLINVLPHLPDHTPKWQIKAARITHRLFYVLMFLIPIDGWLISSSAGVSVSFFGLLVLPDLISANKALMPIFIAAHKWMSYGLIGVIGLHTGAAVIVHQLIYRDHILRRIFP